MSTSPRDQSALLPNRKPQRTRTGRPREPLWELRQGTRVLHASVITYHDGAVELQVFCDGEFFSGQRCGSREAAAQYGGKVYGDYLALGWKA